MEFATHPDVLGKEALALLTWLRTLQGSVKLEAFCIDLLPDLAPRTTDFMREAIHGLTAETVKHLRFVVACMQHLTHPLAKLPNKDMHSSAYEFRLLKNRGSHLFFVDPKAPNIVLLILVEYRASEHLLLGAAIGLISKEDLIPMLKS